MFTPRHTFKSLTPLQKREPPLGVPGRAAGGATDGSPQKPPFSS